MGEYFVLVAAQVGTLFLLMVVGYVLARLGRFGHETQAQVTTLLLYVVTPCLIVDTLQLSPSPQLIRLMGQCLVLSVVTLLGFALLMNPFFRRQEPDARTVLRFGAAYGNTGFFRWIHQPVAGIHIGHAYYHNPVSKNFNAEGFSDGLDIGFTNHLNLSFFNRYNTKQL